MRTEGHLYFGPVSMEAGFALLCRLMLCTLFVLAAFFKWSHKKGWDTQTHVQRMLLSGEPTMAYLWEGQVVAAKGPNGTVSTMLLPGQVATGIVLAEAAANPQPSVEACGLSCLSTDGCNVFAYCPLEAGCFSTVYKLSSPYQGCKLIDQELSGPPTGRPAVFVQAPGFIGGAPLIFEVPAIEGYAAMPGAGFWYRYDYGCPGTVSQQASCGLKGSPQELAGRCDADPSCLLMSWFPQGRDYLGYPVTLFKGGPGVTLNLSEANFNHNSVLYVKKAAQAGAIVSAPSNHREQSSSEDGGGRALSTGAVVGIALVGACCCAALLTLLAVATVQRHRRQRQEQQQQEEEQGASLSKREEGPPELSGLRAQPRPHRKTIHPPPPPPPPTAVSGLSSLEPHFGNGAAWQPTTSSNRQQSVPAPLQVLSLSLPPAWSSTASPVPSSESQAPAADAESKVVVPDTESWRSCCVPLERIHFCRSEEGELEELGCGAFSKVFKVTLDGVPHAAKVLLLGSAPWASEALLKEVGLLRQLSHPNIVTFAGVCASDGRGVILMELMGKGDLHSLLRQDGSGGHREWGWHARGAAAALDVAKGLAYLHSLNLTHFDVKPRNTLLTDSGTAKLADVGFSRAMRNTHHSLSGGPAGTFDYMAPEVLMGRRCTYSADIFSLGILMWELCTGDYPIRGTLRNLDCPRECPTEVAELCWRCMSEEPMQRPSAAQVVELLSRLQPQHEHR